MARTRYFRMVRLPERFNHGRDQVSLKFEGVGGGEIAVIHLDWWQVREFMKRLRKANDERVDRVADQLEWQRSLLDPPAKQG